MVPRSSCFNGDWNEMMCRCKCAVLRNFVCSCLVCCGSCALCCLSIIIIIIIIIICIIFLLLLLLLLTSTTVIIIHFLLKVNKDEQVLFQVEKIDMMKKSEHIGRNVRINIQLNGCYKELANI